MAIVTLGQQLALAGSFLAHVITTALSAGAGTILFQALVQHLKDKGTLRRLHLEEQVTKVYAPLDFYIQ